MKAHDISAGEWKFIPGFKKKYKINRSGQVVSLFHSKPMLIATHTDTYGYRYATLQLDGVSRMRLVHRIIYEAFVGKIPPGHHINHKDFNKQNNSLNNLEACTPDENYAHATAGGMGYGAIRTVFENLKSGKRKEFTSQNKAAKELGITTGNMYRLVTAYRNGRKSEFNGWKLALLGSST